MRYRFEQEEYPLANQENLHLLMRGVKVWNQWKENTHEILPSATSNVSYDADLSGADLSGADLSGVNLGKVDLTGVNFGGSQLVGVCLAEAELAEAHFVKARLNGADLKGANICGADFTDADLRGADLRGADLSDTCFQNANLSGVNLSGANLDGARLKGIELSDANFSEIYSGVCFLYPSFQRSSIRRAKAAGAAIHQDHIEGRRTKEAPRLSFVRKDQNQQIVLPVRINARPVRLMGLSLLFVIGGFWLLHTPGNMIQTVMGMLAVLFFGLGVVFFLLQFLCQLVRRIPMLIINGEGIQYFQPSLLNAGMSIPMTHWNIALKWREIGAIGFVKGGANSFVVYAPAKRWRSEWSPSIQIPLTFLPISAQQVLILIQERYQKQLEGDGIEIVEVDPLVENF